MGSRISGGVPQDLSCLWPGKPATEDGGWRKCSRTPPMYHPDTQKLNGGILL